MIEPGFDICQEIYNSQSWDETLAAHLREFDAPQKTWETLVSLARQANFRELFPTFFPSLMEFVAQSYDPDLALTNFERFADKIYDKNYFYTLLASSRDLVKALVFLFSGSQSLSDALLNDPSCFDWLKQPDTLGKPKSKDALFRDYHALAGNDLLGEDTPRLLRRFKRMEYIRIGLKDLLGLSEMMETVADISNIADVCLQVAYEYADKQLKKKHGVPMYEDVDGAWKESEFAVLGMGKLGGRELNYSSDIDLIYIYTSSKGETHPDPALDSCRKLSNHEYFSKLAQLITKTINEITLDGNVFRVDLNLRPEGQSGEIVNSLASCEIYYQSWGRTWERQALIKARVSAGSENLGKTFFALLQPFIYRRHLDFAAVEEIRAMKDKIDESLKAKKAEKGNIKLGFGGIREIEFSVQGYQLLFGGRDTSLRVSNTLITLDRLQEKGLILPKDHRSLKAAYIFLRNLENRVQISFGLQTHMLPKDEKNLTILARKMRVPGKTCAELVAGLFAEYERHTQFVGNFFAGLFVEEKKKTVREIADRGWEQARITESNFTENLLQDIPFSDSARAFQFLKSLRDGSENSRPTEKSIQAFYAILPGILRHCAEAPRHNSAVENLVRFIEASRARDTFFDLFRDNEKFLELLCILFGSSDYLADILIKQPALIDVLLNTEAIYRYKPQEKIADEIQRGLEMPASLEDKKLFLRRFKQCEELRIGTRYLIKEADLPGTLADLSNLADVFLQTSFTIAWSELKPETETACKLAIIGMGKLGGKELNFGSDLDIVFVYDEPEACRLQQEEILTLYISVAQMIGQLASEMTSAGIAYKIDTDLRPEGSKGVLIMSVQGYQDYLLNRARVWEQQSLTRARYVAGDLAVGEKFLKTAHAFVYRPKLEYGSLIEISRLRERMEMELAQESQKGKNVKLGYGGLADIEFAVQILQMMHGFRHPRLRITNMTELLKQMATYGIVDQAELEQVGKYYLYLRNIECVLRISGRQSTNYLPDDADTLASMAKLLGYREKDSEGQARQFKDEYEATTQAVRKFYRKIIGTLLRTAL